LIREELLSEEPKTMTKRGLASSPPGGPGLDAGDDVDEDKEPLDEDEDAMDEDNTAVIGFQGEPTRHEPPTTGGVDMRKEHVRITRRQLQRIIREELIARPMRTMR
jgi:hypothetical protein